MIRGSIMSSLCLYLLALAAVANCAAPYQFPILVDQQHRQAHPHAQRRYDEPIQVSSANRQAVEQVPEQEAQQLQQLHQVVDTMAALLNEQEQQQQQQQQRRHQLQDQQVAPRANAQDLMSESEIRLALEELEKVHQHERQQTAVAESRQRPIVAAPPSQEPQQQQQSQQQPQQSNDNKAYDSVMDDLGEELIDEQLNMASQEAERLLQQRESPRVAADNARQLQEQRPPSAAPQLNINGSASSNNPTETLYTGELDSMSAELGPALTNDFYSFHAAEDHSTSNNRAPQGTQDLSVNVQMPSNQQMADQAQQKPSTNQANDLESAAQTRNIRQELRSANSFEQDQNNLRFDLSQPPIPHSGPPQPQPPQPTPPAQPVHNQENLVRQFRQQTGANIDNGQFPPPTSTLVPIASPDQFWRPSGPQLDNNQLPPQANGDDINQQYNRLHQQQLQQLPPLPPARFQSLSPAPPPQGANQFPQPSPIPIPRNAQHIQFSGHSFVPPNGQAQFPSVQPTLNNNNNNNNNNMREQRSFTSTSPPMISVLSRGDTSIGNSVSWNPPAAINHPPSQHQFNQQFPGATQASRQQPGSQIINTESPQTFFPPPPQIPQSTQVQNPQSSLFGGPFPVPHGHRSVQNEFRQQPAFAPSTEINNQPIETTTEDRFQFPATTTTTTTSTTTTQRSVPQIDVREASNSDIRSSIRAINNQRFFSPNDLIGPTSTPASIYTEPARTSRLAATTTTAATPTTVAATTTPSGIASNTTKKDDMVIYYYYYYDDNKNATVVAKNVTSRPPTLDEAIEADAGVEDTPYMDDPAPGTNQRTSPAKPPVTTTSSTTTSTTTSATVTPTIAAGMRTQPAASSRFNSVDHEADGHRVTENSFNQMHGNQHRNVPTTTNKHANTRPTQDSVSPFTTAPHHMSSTTSQRPSSRLPQESHNAPVAHSNRFTPSEASRFSPARESHHHHNQHSTTAATPKNNKLQNELIQNALNNPPPNTYVRQQNSLSSVPNAVTPSTGSRGPLSNVSRYGTNNHLLLDPYGLDPTAPATLANSAHSPTTDNSPNQHHKSWPSSSNERSHNHAPAAGNRMPSSVTPASTRDYSPTESALPKNLAISTSTRSSNSNNQHFSSQRSNSPNMVPTPSPAQVSRATSSQSVTRTSGNHVTPATRQLFPETNIAQHAGSAAHDHGSRVPSHSQKQSSIDHHKQPARQLQSTTPDMSSGFTSSEAEELQEPQRETISRLNNNGRPSTPDGNTGNGFTKSPVQLSSPVTEISPTTSRIQNIPSSPVSNTPLTTSFSISTSKSSSSVMPVSTSSPLPISSQPITTTVTQSMSTSVSSSSSITPSTSPDIMSPQTTVSNTPTSTTSAPTESSSSTESSDSAITSTRKKFGNRNNRFQTRINSISASARSSTTTSTTQAPSVTSTTRRPTTSTTRKSSKQLFAGRRRLSSVNQSENNGNSSLVTSSSTVSANSPVAPSVVTESSSPASPPVSLPGRSRFGNSFTSRSRSTTSSPIASNSEQNVQSQPKPASLFGGQRTSKPRLPFMRGNNNRPTSTTTESSIIVAEPASGSLSDVPAETLAPAFNSDKSVTEKSLTTETSSSSSSSPSSSSSSEETSENSLNNILPAVEEDLSSKKEQTLSEVTTVPSPPPPAVSSSAASTTEATSGRNKPRVRPLFASRQRSSSLFGNRRSNNSTSTA